MKQDDKRDFKGQHLNALATPASFLGSVEPLLAALPNTRRRAPGQPMAKAGQVKMRRQQPLLPNQSVSKHHPILGISPRSALIFAILGWCPRKFPCIRTGMDREAGACTFFFFLSCFQIGSDFQPNSQAPGQSQTPGKQDDWRLKDSMSHSDSHPTTVSPLHRQDTWKRLSGR